MNKDLEKSFGFNRKSIKMTCRAIELDGTQEAAILEILEDEKDLLAKIEVVLAASKPTVVQPPVPVVPAIPAPATDDGSDLVT